MLRLLNDGLGQLWIGHTPLLERAIWLRRGAVAASLLDE
jgi:hypothetical protein